MNRHGLLSAVGCQLIAFGSGGALPAQRSGEEGTFVRDTNVAVPMRDGVVLRADVWRPTAAGRYAVLVYRTPYNRRASSAAQATAAKAVKRGYVVVMQDVRGRYASDGDYLPYQQEGRDGYDTIEWAAAQPWSNGSVGTYGLSYPGAVQWLAAIESPPHLKAMAPAMTFASPMQFWYSNGVWDTSWITWIYYNIAPDLRRRRGLGGLRSRRQIDSAWQQVGDSLRRAIPLLALKEFVGVAPWYYEWLRHPAFDRWWSWAELRDQYTRTDAAVLNLSAWHDEAYGPHGATSNFAGLVAGRPGGSSRSALIIGPWTHGVPGVGDTIAGDRVFGDAARIDYDETVLRWMDRYVREIDNGVDREKPVRVFVMGSNRWVEAAAWPVPGVRSDTILLIKETDATTIVSDPRNPVTDAFADRAGAHDYRAIALRPDVVVFETPPLEDDLTVVGAMRAELDIAVDAPDTDLWVKVYDVAPDGRAFNLMSPGLDVQRASYRNATSRRELLEPNRRYRLTFNDLLTANTFRKGHRIRVAVMTTFAPHFSPNLHTGELESVSPAPRPARVTVFHQRSNPGRLILPVLPASAMLPADR